MVLHVEELVEFPDILVSQFLDRFDHGNTFPSCRPNNLNAVATGCKFGESPLSYSVRSMRVIPYIVAKLVNFA